MISRNLPEAQWDILEGSDYYDSVRAGLGDDFVAEVRKAIDRVAAQPRLYGRVDPPIRGREVRQNLVHRFPFTVIYEVTATEGDYRGGDSRPAAGPPVASSPVSEATLMRHIPDYPLWLGHAGDAHDKHELLRLGIGAVIDLAVEEPPAVAGHEMVYCRFPLIDGTDNPPWLLRAAIDTTATFLRHKVPTLVACGGGLSRAPAIAAGALVQLGRPNLQDALLYLAQFGRCDVTAGLLQDVVRATSPG